MDEEKEAITCIQEALAEAKKLGLSQIVVPLEDALYILQYKYIERHKKHDK